MILWYIMYHSLPVFKTKNKWFTDSTSAQNKQDLSSILLSKSYYWLGDKKEDMNSWWNINFPHHRTKNPLNTSIIYSCIQILNRVPTNRIKLPYNCIFFLYKL
jgi:hypothetical protein